MTITTLITRLEALTESDRLVDAAIAVHIPPTPQP